MIIRPKGFTSKIKEYRCSGRAVFSNKRFNEHITKEDVCEVLFKFNFKCFYCNEPINKKTWQLDHFNPRANGGLNVLENLVCTCKWCNTMKNALDGNAFINKCHNIVNNNFFIRNNIQNVLEDCELNRKLKTLKKKFSKLNTEKSDVLLDIIKETFKN